MWPLTRLMKIPSTVRQHQQSTTRQLCQEAKPPQQPSPQSSAKNYQPGDGIRSMRSTTLFRTINFELYAKPNVIVMGIGLVAFTIAIGYVAYMRSQYESQGYYAAMQKDGTEVFTKKRSKWE